MRLVILSTLAVALALAPLATAQVPTPSAAPVYTVSIENAPAELTGLNAANATARAPFQVVLVLSNVFCASAVTIPVTLSATAANAPANLITAVEPNVINITVSQGPHGAEPLGSPGGGTGDSVLIATVDGNITANASAQITLLATAPAPPSGAEGCQGAGPIGEAASEPVTIFANMTAPPAPPVEEPVEEDTPGLGVLAVAATAAVAAFARRRKA